MLLGTGVWDEATLTVFHNKPCTCTCMYLNSSSPSKSWMVSMIDPCNELVRDGGGGRGGERNEEGGRVTRK